MKTLSVVGLILSLALVELSSADFDYWGQQRYPMRLSNMDSMSGGRQSQFDSVFDSSNYPSSEQLRKIRREMLRRAEEMKQEMENSPGDETSRRVTILGREYIEKCKTSKNTSSRASYMQKVCRLQPADSQQDQQEDSQQDQQEDSQRPSNEKNKQNRRNQSMDKQKQNYQDELKRQDVK